MKTNEFKAWFDGFVEAMSGQPTEAQWEKIKKRVSEIDGTPVSYPVFVDRYWQRAAPYWWNGVTYCSGGTTPIGQEVTMLASHSDSDAALPGVMCAQTFDAVAVTNAALFALGKSDFEDLKAA